MADGDDGFDDEDDVDDDDDDVDVRSDGNFARGSVRFHVI